MMIHIIVKTLTGLSLNVAVDPSGTVYEAKTRIQDGTGTPIDQQRLIFSGVQLSDEDILQHRGIQNGSTLHLVLRLRGMISTFTSNDASDPLVAYLMMSDGERANAPLPLEELQTKQGTERANPFYNFRYIEDPDIMHPSQLSVLCDLLDFMWANVGGDGRDLRLTLSQDQFVAIMAPLDGSLENRYDSRTLAVKFQKRFHDVPTAFTPSTSTLARGFKIALRMTRGPTNSCINFHCDGGYASSTSQIPLNSPEEYDGGRLCFFVNDNLHFVPRQPGSLVQHPPQVLHGVTSVTRGVRKSLFLVDQSNGLGAGGVVTLTSDHVTSFLADHAGRP